MMAVALASVLQPLDNPRTPSHGDLAHPSARRGKAKTRLRSSSSRSWPRSNLSRARAPGKKHSLPETKTQQKKQCPTSTPAASTTSPPRRRKKTFQEDAPRPRASLEEETSRGGRPVPGTILWRGAPASPPHRKSRSGRRPGSPMPLSTSVRPVEAASRPSPEGTTVDIAAASSATTARNARC